MTSALSAAIYARVSTRQQFEDGSSIDSQEAACRKLALAQGFQVTQVFKEDFPGTELQRPLLDQLRIGIKHRAYSAVFCYSTDRLSRNPIHLGLLAEECLKAEVGLIFVTEPIDMSPEGQLLTFVRGWSSQLERERIKDRTVRGKASRMSAGKLPQGTGRTGTAYGYRYSKATGTRTIEPDEAQTVKELFTLSANGHSVVRLANYLTACGVASPTGGQWQPRSVLFILRNPIYTGVTYFNRTKRIHVAGKRNVFVPRPKEEWTTIEGATPAIVDQALFQAVQTRLDQPFAFYVPPHTNYLLTGFIRCGCGGPVSGHRCQADDRYRYYRCGNTVDKPNRPKSCTARSVRVLDLEPVIWQEIVTILQDPETIVDELRRRQGSTDALDEEIARVAQTIKSIEVRKTRAVRLYTLGQSDDETIEKELARINKLLTHAKQQASELTQRRAQSEAFEPLAELVTNYCQQVAQRLDNMGFAEKREVLAALQAKVVLDGGRVRILVVLPAPYEKESYTQSCRSSGYIAQGGRGLPVAREIRLAA